MFDKSLETAIVPVTPFQQNATVFWCTNTMKGAVIDPGGHLDRIRKTHGAGRCVSGIKNFIRHLQGFRCRT